MRTSLPYILEGEVLEVQDFATKNRKNLRYICKVSMDDGSIVILPNCVQATLFGGIDDYLQFRSRTNKDSGVDTTTVRNDEKNAAQVGDHVLIAFIGGNVNKPVIVGYAQHPNQTYEFEDEDPTSDSFQPNLIFKYLGVKVTVDEKGQLRIIHRGAPKIEYKPRSNGLLGDALAAASSLASATSSGGPGKDKPNVAVTPQDSTEITLFEFLKGGIFRLRDADGQVIEVDRTKQRIFISNNSLKSTESDSSVSLGSALSAGVVNAESITLDESGKGITIQARNLIEFNSGKDRKDITKGDYTSNIIGNSQWTIGGNEELKIKGNQQLDIAGDHKEKIAGDWEIQLAGTATVKASGATLKLGKGKVGLGGVTAELLDLFNQTLTQLISTLTDIQAETHVGNLGFPTSPPVNTAAFASLQASVTQIQTLLGTIKGGI